MVILLVLLLLSIGALVGRLVYLRFFEKPEASVSVPDNLIGTEGAADSSKPPETSDPPAATDDAQQEPTGTVGGETGEIPASTAAEAAAQADGSRQATVLELSANELTDNSRFEVSNMFPGDSVTKYFCVRAYHDAQITLYFRADVTEQTKELGNVLHIKVTRLDNGTVLLEDVFNGIDGKELSELLPVSAGNETECYYQVDVYLDTSVGNEYQAANLKADFSWFVKDDSGMTPPSKTGDDADLLLWVAVAIGALLMLLILLKRRREGEAHEQE